MEPTASERSADEITPFSTNEEPYDSGAALKDPAQKAGAELFIAVNIALRNARKLKAELKSRSRKWDQMVREQDMQMAAVERELEEAKGRADAAERAVQSRAAAAEAKANAMVHEVGRELVKRERAAERRTEEARLKCDAQQREIEALRQVILQLGGAAAEAQVPRHSAARVLSPRANAPLAKTPPGLPPGHSGLAGNGSPISPHRRTKLEVLIADLRRVHATVRPIPPAPTPWPPPPALRRARSATRPPP